MNFYVRGRTRERLEAEFLPSPLLGTFTAIALCCLVPIWVISETPEPQSSSWLGALVATIIAGARFAWIVSSRQRRLFEMTTWLFMYSFMSIAPLVQLRAEADPGTTPNVDHRFDFMAIGIVLIAQIALVVGSISARGRGLEQRGTTLKPARRVDVTRTRVALWGMVASAVLYIGLVGPSTLFLPRNERTARVSEAFSDPVVSAILSGFVTLGLLTAIVASLEVQRRVRIAGGKTQYFPIVVSTVPLLVVVNPIGSARYVLLTVLLALLAALGGYSRLGRFRAVALLSLAAMFLVFPLLDVFRRSLDATIVATDPIAALLSGDFDSYAQLVNTVDFVDANGVPWGTQILGVLLFWVPRSFWPSKPVDTGILLAEYKGYWFTNLSAPLPAELYVNAGLAGVLVGSLAFGYLIRRWDVLNEAQMRQFGVPTVLGCVLPFYFVLLLRGSLLQAAAALTVVLVIWFLTTKPTRFSETTTFL